jgi:hypothetical protein
MLSSSIFLAFINAEYFLNLQFFLLSWKLAVLENCISASKWCGKLTKSYFFFY